MKQYLKHWLALTVVAAAAALLSNSTPALAQGGCKPVDEEVCGAEPGCTFCSGEQCGGWNNCHYACGGAQCP